MQSACLQRRSQKERCGFALLLMVLLIVVIGGLLWLDPWALFNRSDPELPWNQGSRLVKAGEEVPAPLEEQPQITQHLLFEAEAEQDGSGRGKIGMVLQRNGRIEGGWGAEYYPRPNINHTVMGCTFKGNIDPSKIYSDDDGEYPSQLYFITKGKFIIMETNSETNIVRKVAGRIYVTGWLDAEYNAIGKITITQDKRSFQTFSWQAQGIEQKTIFDFFKIGPLGK